MRKGVLLWLLVGLFISCTSSPARKTDFKVIVLGFDGVDPDLVRQWLHQLPHIRRLAEQGTLTGLATTNPPESPVAWASFATGMNPGKHGIFDFLRPDTSTYLPETALYEAQSPRFFLGTVPIRKAQITNNRRAVSFWEHLDRAGISSTNLRLPVEFPPSALDHGSTLSGLGVPDILGTWGTYFYFATDLTQWDLDDGESGARLVRLNWDKNRLSALLEGPADPLGDDRDPLSIPLELELNEEATAVTIRVQNQEQTIEEGAWSDWFGFEFSAGPFFTFRGASRFYVLETYPEVRVYLMPISLAPDGSHLPLSFPEGVSRRLATSFGSFKTQGWLDECWGLNDERIDEAVFLEDLWRNMNQLEEMLVGELDKGTSSLYTAVFTGTDSVSHMFYRLLDPQHPRYDQDLASRYGDTIQQVYRKMDSIIGKVSDRLTPRDLLLVLSDHGFHSWRKGFNTNTWLAVNGYLNFKEEPAAETTAAIRSGGKFFPNVDWARTRAYAIGLGQIYFNLKGRESRGIVEPGGESQKLGEEIRERILRFTDPDTGELVLRAAYLRGEIYQGSEVEKAGDIRLTFRPGYRISWESALGAVPANIVVANLKKWSGDHASSDADETAGFLLSSRRLKTRNPSLLDIAPTLYRLFEASVPDQVDGSPLEFESAPVR